MKILKWIRNALSESDSKAKAVREVRSIIEKAHELLSKQDYEDARQVLLSALRLRDRLVDRKTINWILASLGSTWLFQERFDEQIAFFSEYIVSYPLDCAAYRQRAEALWYSGQLRKAIEDYSRAIELEPTDLESRSGRGQVLAEIGENDRGMEDLEMALRIVEGTARPNESWREWIKDAEAFIRNGRAMALAGLGKTDDAMSEFDASIVLSPENAWVYFNRARVYESRENKVRALSDYRTSLEKTQPSLSPLQKARARLKILELDSGSSGL